MITVNPYLHFPGHTEEAFNFYKSVFGGDFVMIQRYKDTPEKDRTPAEDQDKIMHMALPIGSGSILMGTDAIGQRADHLQAGNNFYLAVGSSTKEEADQVYTGLSAGGKATMPMEKTFWGAYFGMLIDKFGIKWMVSFDENFKPQ